MTTVLFICTAINLIGMGFLFYVRDLQKDVNREILANATLSSVIDMMTKSKLEELEDRISKLEPKPETDKN